MILADQVNAGVLGCYGGPVPTPNIDRLADEGVLFTETTCVTPFCSPSRASILTGRYPHSHGIVTNVNRSDYPAISSLPTEEGIKRGDITAEKLLNEAGVANRTVERLRTLESKPFMITCSFNAPHDPNIVPSPYYESFSPDKIELPSNFGHLETRFEKE